MGVSAINASEILVTYNTDVDAQTAGDKANYNIKKNTGASGDEKVDVKDVLVEGNTALLRVDEAFNPSDKFAVEVKDAVKSTDGMKLEAYATSTMVFGDVAAPKVENAAFDGSTVQLTFDKPVDETVGLVKVDGTSIDNKDLVFTGDPSIRGDVAGNYTYNVQLTGDDETDAVSKEGNHEVTLFDVAETSTTNPAVASVVNATYTVDNAKVAPEVVGLHALNGNKFFVELNKPADLDSAASLVVSQGNHVFTTISGDSSIGTAASSVFYQKDTWNGKYGYYVAITDNYSDESENPLYSKNQTSAKLDVTLKNYKDADKLVGKTYTGSVTLNKAADKPEIDDTSLNTDLNELYVDFEKSIKPVEGLDKSDVVVRDKEGVVIPSEDYNLSIVDIKDSEENVVVTDGRLQVKFTGQDLEDYVKNNEPFTVELKAEKFQYASKTNGTVKEYQLVGAKNDKLTVTIKSADQDKFKYVAFGADEKGEIDYSKADENIIEINYERKMDDSAIDVANYKLDGEALPEGTEVDFYDNKKKVRITLPDGTVQSEEEYKFTIDTAVKTVSGLHVVKDIVTQKPYEEVITLKDNVAPELESGAVYVIDDKDAEITNKIKLTFSESVEVTDVTGDAEGAEVNFNVEVGEGNQKVASVADSSDNNKLEDNELIITLVGDGVNVDQSATVTVVKDDEGKMYVTDGKGNELVAGGKALIAESATEIITPQ
ncbi:hypothetical protein ACW2QC_00930 [Virgibacillus sp. FSP13]